MLALVIVLVAVGPWALEKITGKPRTRHGYGLLGGTVCPKCGKPFGLHWWAPHIGLGRYDRCPHCGKWSAVRFASAERLREAEKLMGDGPGEPTVQSVSAEEQLRREIDDSRFDS